MPLNNGFDSTIHVYLQHGWGFNRDCFQKWLPALEGVAVTLLDRGYWGAAVPLSQADTSTKTVLVCHSLGLHFFSESQLRSVDLLVVIGGFASFHGLNAENQLSKKHIKRMRGRLKQEPEQLLSDFYRDCAWPGDLPDFSAINVDLLADDLLLLDTVRLQHTVVTETEVLILHGANDRIVPIERARELHKQISGSLYLIDGAGHGLPFTHVGQCVQIIKDQLSVSESK